MVLSYAELDMWKNFFMEMAVKHKDGLPTAVVESHPWRYLILDAALRDMI